MKELLISRASEADLLEIWSYLFEHSERAADRVVGEITGKYNLLCEFPLMGRRRTEFGADYRSFAVGNYVIIYRVLDTKLVVSRVLHGSRDTSGLFTLDEEDM